MATSKTKQTSSDFEEYIRDLLECPVCKETIKSVPVYQCNNGHVICNECIRELTSCPICRNNSKPARSLKLEKIVQRLEGVLPENEGTITAETFNPQKWGKGSVRVYGTINGPTHPTARGHSRSLNQEPHIELNLQSNPEPLNTRQSLSLPCDCEVALIYILVVFVILFLLGFFGLSMYLFIEWSCYPGCPHGKYR